MRVRAVKCTFYKSLPEHLVDRRGFSVETDDKGYHWTGLANTAHINKTNESGLLRSKYHTGQY
jgi:hypothetical protein